MAFSFSNLVWELQQRNVDLEAEELCDAIWLAARGFAPGSISETPDSRDTSGISPLPREESDQTVKDDPAPHVQTLQPSNPATADHAVHALSGSSGTRVTGSPISLPAVPALSRSVELDRALRALRLKRHSSNLVEVDEEATATAVSETGVWQVITRPVRGRWLDISLVIEQSPSMRLWQDTAVEFRNLLWRACAPRSLHSYYVQWGLKATVIRTAGGRQVSPNGPFCPSNSRVVLVMSDALGLGWMTADIPALLAKWAKRNPTTLVQLLPPPMWSKTALRNVELAPIRRALSSSFRPSVIGAAPWVTVTGLEPDLLRNYAQMLTGHPVGSTAAFRMAPDRFRVVSRDEIAHRQPFNVETVSKEDIDSLFGRFESFASPEARVLARHLASTPLLLPVMRLVQRTLVPEAAPAQLAEIFQSGILYRRSASVQPESHPNHVEYDFLPGLRERLLDLGGIDLSFNTREIVSRYLEHRFGKGGTFTALVNTQSTQTGEWNIASSAPGLQPFARIGNFLVNRMGIEAKAIATPQHDAERDNAADDITRYYHNSQVNSSTIIKGLDTSEHDNLNAKQAGDEPSLIRHADVDQLPGDERSTKTKVTVIADALAKETAEPEHAHRSRSLCHGCYKTLSVLGSGGEGRVYEAECVNSRQGIQVGERLAIKIVDRQLCSEGQLTKLRKSSEILQQLTSPHIVRHRDFFTEESDDGDELACIVMEMVTGRGLKSYIQETAQGAEPTGLPWNRAREIFEQCLEALSYAASRGVVHKDFKPSNVIITKDGAVKLIDFGVALVVDEDSSVASGIRGTMDYMAPEILTGKPTIDHEQADIFSFGVCFFEALTGKLPFPSLGSEIPRYMARWLASAPPDLSFSHKVFRVHPSIRSFIKRCLDASTEQRYKRFTEVLTAFKAIGPRIIRSSDENIYYEFVDWIGRGGFAEVFKGRRVDKHSGLSTLVAIKHLVSGMSSADRFITEARLIREHPHPHLVEFVDFLSVPTNGKTSYYLVLEFLEGMPQFSLRGRINAAIKQQTLLLPGEVLPYFDGYLQALRHLHECGIYHRGIKPGDLYAPPDQPEKAKLFDLGISLDSKGTLTGGFLPGCPDYMAPENAPRSAHNGSLEYNNRGDALSDIYALSLCLFEAVCGTPAFPPLPRGEVEVWMAFIKRAEKPLPVNFSHPVFAQYPNLKAVIAEGLQWDPQKRFRSAEAMRQALRTALAP